MDRPDFAPVRMPWEWYIDLSPEDFAAEFRYRTAHRGAAYCGIALSSATSEQLAALTREDLLPMLESKYPAYRLSAIRAMPHVSNDDFRPAPPGV